MSDVKLRVALLGAGRIGQEHSRTLIADPRVQVVAVCDPRLEAARQTAATIPGAVATDESREILSSSGVDAIIICTPTDSHALLIEEGARAHKAVFCEKPPLICKERDRLFGCWRKVVFPFKLDSNDDLTPAMRKPGTRPPSFLYGSFPRRVSCRAGGFFYCGLGADQA